MLHKHRKKLPQNKVTKSRRIRTTSGLSKSDINKLLSFSENPLKHATGTSKAKEKIKYLEGIKDKLSEGQLATYITAREQYDVALSTREVSLSQKKDTSKILTEAFTNHKSVKIRYKGSWRTIDPYALNQTYCVAYCHFARDIRTFRIDRVQGAELLKDFDIDRSLKKTAQGRIGEAPSYKGYHRRY